MRIHLALAASLAAALAGCSAPDEPSGPGPAAAATAPVTVERAWSRATAPGVPVGAGYLTIRNAGPDNDQLVAVSSPAAGEVQVHESLMAGGEAQMRQQESLPVPAGGSLVLEPGGYHLMLLDLKAPLVAGQRVPVKLQFDKAGTVTAELVVGKAGAPAPEKD